MRKVFRTVALAAMVALGGCCLFTSVNKEFVRGVDGYAAEILPEYEAYVEADAKLQPESRKLRKETAQSFRALIEQAKKD